MKRNTTHTKVLKLKALIRKQNPKAIVSVTSTNSPKSEVFEINVKNSKSTNINSIFKIVHGDKIKDIRVLVSGQPVVEKVMSGKSKSQTRLRIKSSSFIDITSAYVK